MITETRSLLNLCAADIMSHQVVMIPREMSLPGAARMLARAGITGAPVVDVNGCCIGVLSATDFMNWVKAEHPTSAPETISSAWQIPEGFKELTVRVEDCMTKDPVLVTAGTKIAELARMMMDAHVHRLIVVEGVSQRPIGIVSSMDVLAALARTSAEAETAENLGNALVDTVY